MAGMEVDTLVATLMSLGFDFDGCQQAIAEGNSTVEAAVEWLLNRGNSKSKTVDKTQDVKSTKNNESCHSSSTIEDKSDEHVVSRYVTDESQKKAQDEFEQKKRDNIQREAKKRRLIDKQVRQEVLQQIKEDRDIANSRRPRGKQEKQSVLEPDVTTTSHADTSSDFTKNICRLKIRLSSGRNVTETCESCDTLLDVITRIKQTYNESDHLDIVQAFPRKTFTGDDLQQSLMTLGLTPGGCLVLKKSSGTTGEQGEYEHHGGEAVESQGRPGDLQGQDDIESDPDITLPGPDLARHVWGAGVSQGGQRDEGGEDIPHEGGEDIPHERGEDIPHERGEDIPHERGEDIPQQDEIEGGIDIAVPDQDIARHQHVWGAGLSLGRHPYNPHVIVPVIHSESAAEAAEARSRTQTVQHQGKPGTDPISLPSQDVSTLVDICIKDIAKRLPGHHHPVGSLAPLPQRLCLKILKHLMKKKTLTPKTLNSFVPCQLQQLVLDHYLYVTNELFHTIRFFKGLTHLSVQSCTVFTDKALEAIAGLKKIIHLDFSNCTQLTNKCLKHLKTHRNLETLKLDNTKVTDEGLCPLFKDSEWNKLHTLSLSKTAVSNITLQALQAKNLNDLHLEQTNVSELQALAGLTCLAHLNVGGTRITDQSLLCLRNHPSLKKLNLHQTQVCDQGLAHLAGLQLVELRLPNRLNITDVGISYLQDLPLTSMDLTDYVNITDEALRTVGQLTRLTRLSLSKTKISDNGMQLLSGLVSLRELDLERTAVGDDGLDVLSCLGRLEELNLSGTRVTDDGLATGKLNFLRLLCKLNLSRTNVSDSGVANLQLPELTLLNLDWTLTTEQCRNLLGGCPQLQALRRQNCRTENRLGEM